MSERKLKAWEEAGLIDVAAAARIREWEAENSKPIGLWALIGLGALAIGLGLVSVVAANWDAIPGEARLAIHFTLMLALTGFLIWQRGRALITSIHFHDAMLFIAGALGLTFFGHIGQVYQTSSPLWQPLGLWLLLFTPLMLGYGRGWLAAAAWMGVLCLAAYSHWDWYLGSTYKPADANFPFVYAGVISSVPAFVMAGAGFMRGHSDHPDFWKRLEQLGITLTVWGVSGFQLVYAFGGNGGGAQNNTAGVQAMCLLAAAAAIWFARPTRSGKATAAILGAGVLTLVVAMGIDGSSLGGGILFMLFWGAIAAAALYAPWRIVFQVAVAVLAIRLIILSFELANDLLGSGLGLILAGVATLGIAFLAVRISKRYAPTEVQA